MLDPSQFRNVLSRFATGITVVTGVIPGGKATGVTVNSFSSISMDPPLVMVCLDKRTKSLEAFTEGDCFAIHILGSHQKEVSNRFATVGEDKLVGVEYEEWEGCCPVLRDCLAVLKCHREAVHDAGDHLIVIGRIREMEEGGDREPLLYYRSGYRGMGEPV